MSNLLGKTVDVMLPKHLGGLRRGKIIAFAVLCNDALIIQLDPTEKFNGDIIIRQELDVSVVRTRYAAWGLGLGGEKIIIGDTKDNKQHAINSFKKHIGFEPDGVISKEM